MIKPLATTESGNIYLEGPNAVGKKINEMIDAINEITKVFNNHTHRIDLGANENIVKTRNPNE